jgi:hypothetical protein
VLDLLVAIVQQEALQLLVLGEVGSLLVPVDGLDLLVEADEGALEVARLRRDLRPWFGGRAPRGVLGFDSAAAGPAAAGLVGHVALTVALGTAGIVAAAGGAGDALADTVADLATGIRLTAGVADAGRTGIRLGFGHQGGPSRGGDAPRDEMRRRCTGTLPG